jgi:transposase
MNPWPLSHSVLVVDNASIYKVAGIQQLVEESGMCLLYLPPYSPDLNPIELAFSTIKGWLHSNCNHVNEEYELEGGMVYNIFWEAVYAVTSEHAKG